MSSLASPERIWWKPLVAEEKLWLRIALIWCVFLFAMMIIWATGGNQNAPAETYRTTPQQFLELTNDFVEKYQVGTDNGIPIVRPPPGDVFLAASTWLWGPILELEKGSTYRFHVSSLDLQHGFSIQPVNLNFQVLPGYIYVITLTPDEAGEYQIVCNEYCGTGHNLMVGKMIVTE